MEFSRLEESDYKYFLDLYNTAFPEDERRLYADETHLSDFIRKKEGKFNVLVAKEGGEFVGFLSYWMICGYVYVEHFAVCSEKRGHGTGREMLHYLMKEVSENVLLEVEMPDTEEARRRIQFYERNGFVAHREIHYLQPPYSVVQSSLRMLLMTHGNINLSNASTISCLQREVYNTNV